MFASHKSRKHNPHHPDDFKHSVFQTYSSQASEDSCLIDESEVTSDETVVNEGEDLVSYC